MTRPNAKKLKNGGLGLLFRLPPSAFLIFLLLAAFALRLFRLDAQSLWWDEGISLNLATSTLAEIAADRVVNIHPPLYFFGLKAWVSLVGLTPFAARYSSVLASWLQIAAVYAFSRRWMGSKTAVWTAVGLIAISPLSIIYGQETRVYAILPLIYLALLILTGRITRNKSRIPRSLWVGLVVIEAVGLHLHYIVLFLAAFISLWALFTFSRRRQWQNLRHWIAAQLAVGLLSLPWFIAILMNRLTVQNRVQTGVFLTEPVSWRFLLSQVWVFHLTGLPGLLARPEVKWLSVWAASGLVGLLLLRWRQRRTSLPIAGAWLIPLGMALLIWSVRSFAHPRYIAIYAIGLIPLTAFLIAAAPRRWWTAVFGIPFILLSLWGLWAYFFDPDVAKADMRGAAQYLETAAAATDLIVVPDAGWAFNFEYQGDTPIVMPSFAQPDEMWQRLAQWSDQPRHIFTVMPDRDSRDWQGVLPFALENAGNLVSVTRFDGLIVRDYAIRQPISPPPMTDVFVDYGPLQLVGLWVEEDAAANTALTVALQWRVVAADIARYHADIRLLDADEWPLTHDGKLLVDTTGLPTDEWQPNQIVTTYHLLPLPSGTPPLTYTAAITLLAVEPDGRLRPADWLNETGAPQGQQFRLPEPVRFSPRIEPLLNPYAVGDLPSLPEPARLADGLTLVASGLDRGRVAPGQSLFVGLKWQATDTPLPDLRPKLLLMQAGDELAVSGDAPALGRYPTTLWQHGEQVLEHRQLPVPPLAEAGLAEIVIELGVEQFKIGEVEIVAEDRLFSPPLVSNPVSVAFGEVARLVGYDLPAPTVSAVEPVPLTLYWESLATGSDVSYTIFTHILAEDGRLLGQHDAPPVNGTRLTTGWVQGEYIIDLHEMQFRGEPYNGPAQIEVGLYNPDTGLRLLLPDGRDHFVLPVTLTITVDE